MKSECLDAEQIERYVRGECSDEEREAVERHVAGCESCRREVNTAEENHGFLGRMGKVMGFADRVPGGGDDVATVAESDMAAEEMARLPDYAACGRRMAADAIKGYRILERLEEGGQAVVYRAVQEAANRTVALKVLLHGPFATAQQQRRFEREIELAANLQHPNIVTIFDSGVAQGQYYFAMEYVSGRVLDRYVLEEQMSLRAKMTLFAKVCGAIAHAHQHAVMHRDLKPGNILVDGEGEPHVLDFGLAKTTEVDEDTDGSVLRASVTGQIVGTLAYMSPEQAAGNTRAVDVRTDVYSLGVMFYSALTNTFPYDVSGSPLEILQNIQEADPVRFSKTTRRLDSDIEAIVLKCLAKEPHRRYHSAAELQSDIERWLNGFPVVARSDSSIYLLRKLISRHRYTSTVAGLLIVIVLGFSYVSFDLYLSASRSHRESEEIREQLSRQVGTHESFAQRVSFTLFFHAWRGGRSAEAEAITVFFPRGSLERKGAEFLLDQRSLSEKEAVFRSELEESYPWFADLIIGEYHLKSGSKEEALAAFLAAREVSESTSGQDQGAAGKWLTVQLGARIRELSGKPTNADNKTPSGEIAN